MSTLPPNNRMIPAEGTPYFTPAQSPPAGTAIASDVSDDHLVPKLFHPLRIRGVKFPNRIWVSPMAQYSAESGKLTPWHQAHLGGIFTRGPGLTMTETFAVLPEGRLTPEDAGLWSDDQIESLASIVTFAHSQSQKIGVQIGHAGRKASTASPWLIGDAIASEAVGGWPEDVWGPSAVPFSDTYPQPKELTKEGISKILQAFVDTAMRAVAAGVDVIEVHGAHGFLIHSFLSPISNHRTDEYGGSFENRTRFLIDVVDSVRGAIPETMPLFVRLSGTDWLEEVMHHEPSWRSEDTSRIAPILYAHGVDVLDVSSGGIHPKQKIRTGPAYQSPFARDAMRALSAEKSFPDNTAAPLVGNGKLPRLIITTVGAITSAVAADDLLEDGAADVIFVGKPFLRNTGLVWAWAEELTAAGRAVQIQLAHQIGWPFRGRGKKSGAPETTKKA